MSYSLLADKPSPDEEAASVASLQLAPWVAARAGVIRERLLAEMRGEDAGLDQEIGDALRDADPPGDD